MTGMSDIHDIGTIGIIIPTYNRVTWLQEAVASVLDQSYRAIEILIIDNCSTDDTSNIVSSINDDRVTYVRNDHNLGLAGSINKAIGMLSDDIEWCTVLCDDDYLEKDHIDRMVRTIVSNDVTSIIHSHIIYVDPSRNELKHARISPSEESALDYIKARAEFKRERFLSGILFRRKCFTEMNGYPAFRTGMAADDAMVFALALQDRLAYCRDAVVYVRLHENAESQSVDGVAEHLTALLEYKEFCMEAAKRSGKLGGKQLDHLEACLLVHIGKLSTKLWLRSINKLQYATDAEGKSRCHDLYQLGKANRYNFSLRIVLDSYSALHLGLHPEKIWLYRFIWKKISKIDRFIQKHVRVV